eukprot:945779-Lingulodinium_polyedra.AAC.1
MEVWAQRQATFYSQGSTGTAGKAKAPKVKGKAGPVKLVRKAAADYLQALDGILELSFGVTLSAFGPGGAARLQAEGPTRRMTLVLHQDEGSPAYALSWYLLYHTKLRLVV